VLLEDIRVPRSLSIPKNVKTLLKKKRFFFKKKCCSQRCSQRRSQRGSQRAQWTEIELWFWSLGLGRFSKIKDGDSTIDQK
jgi:hypothetical protein